MNQRLIAFVFMACRVHLWLRGRSNGYGLGVTATDEGSFRSCVVLGGASSGKSAVIRFVGRGSE